ncbi:hypothetical protein CLV62_11871 [Dysgonomonas alginatilytica]|uniref:HipA-like C-terminal domain-containing protein n=1 Tax=Dysgonomonas alginatilytica TaxID=1605892 RepID=A0A2V3PNK6_9BACT|nr:hypothetical protein [Dysgonomonas alginatilytica]PXV62682.1 hypothetical protein CLV62_11871 [Dysgonomonas alginatilytica]
MKKSPFFNNCFSVIYDYFCKKKYIPCKIMPKIIDISKWNKELHVHTTGTRNKFIVISPKDEKFYFKSSLKKKNKDYKYEFWSEVIASKVGYMLNFDVISYNVAYFENEIGCISKSIIDEKDEEHHEGYRYIVEKYPDFKTNFKKTHSFQKIAEALKSIDSEHCIKGIIKMIIFDAIIGNTDRHSENWAIVITGKEIYQILKDMHSVSFWNKLIYNIHLTYKFRRRITIARIQKRYRRGYYKLSPLYDNGSSLGRELDESRINEYLNNQEKLIHFINKGKPDIRWNDKHLNHLELIRTIRLDYPNEVNSAINEIKQRYNKNKLIEIIDNIDKRIPPKFVEYTIPQNRKQFIIKYIDLRINSIIEL